jgi:hypothetical protein
MPRKANPETTLTTASTTSNCIIEKPFWRVDFFGLLILVITPPVTENSGVRDLPVDQGAMCVPAKIWLISGRFLLAGTAGCY